MKKSDFTILTDASILEALLIINEGVTNAVIVTDKDKRLVGIASEGDIRRGLIRGEKPISPITNVINKKPIAIYQGEQKELDLDLAPPNSIIPIINKEMRLVNYILTGEKKIIDNYVVIMAGGFGSRLGKLTEFTPKPMLKIRGKPIIQHIIQKFKLYGFRKFIITTHHMPQKIKNYLGNGSIQNIEIQYIHEEIPLGTAGSIGLLDNFDINEPFIVSNGDIFCDINYIEALKFHSEEQNYTTILTANYEHIIPFGNVIKNQNGSLKKIEEKPTKIYEVLSGNYIFDHSIIKQLEKNNYLDMDELILNQINSKNKISALNCCNYWLDIGTKEFFKKAKHIL